METILSTTGCLPPCSYTAFKSYSPMGTETNYTKFYLKFSKSPLVRRKEVLVYPITSLVAEFGGTFGLFVGFSFVMFWDMTDNVLGFLVKKFNY